MSSSRTQRRPAPSTESARRRRFPIALVVGGVVAVALIAVIVLTMGSGGEEGPLEVGTPTVTGEALPRFESPAADPAVGMPIPQVSGAGFDGTPVSISADGQAKVILFVAHWCDVCQYEVPVVRDWLARTTLPENISLYSVGTGIDPNRPNYPTSEWLERENWTLPVIVDDEAGGVARAFGLGAYPYFVFVDAQGNVAGRLTGALDAASIDLLVAQLAEA